MSFSFCTICTSNSMWRCLRNLFSGPAQPPKVLLKVAKGLLLRCKLNTQFWGVYVGIVLTSNVFKASLNRTSRPPQSSGREREKYCLCQLPGQFLHFPFSRIINLIFGIQLLPKRFVHFYLYLVQYYL